MTASTPNTALAYRVLDQIDAHPETWRQSGFAGWAVRLSGGKLLQEELDTFVIAAPDGLGITGLPVDEAADKLLGHDGRTDTDDLFDAANTREDLGRLVAEIFGPRPLPASEVGLIEGDTAAEQYDNAYARYEADLPPNAGSAS